MTTQPYTPDELRDLGEPPSSIEYLLQQQAQDQARRLNPPAVDTGD